MPSSARLFIATWPPAHLAAALHGLCAAGRNPEKGRLVAPARIHLTLHFLGAVPLDQLPALRAALRLRWEPFELRVSRIAGWGRGLVVAEPEQVPAALNELHATLGDTLCALGLRTELRPFRPHLTLARRYGGPQPAAALAPKAALRWTVRTYMLVQSCLGADGGYRVLRVYRCRPGPRHA